VLLLESFNGFYVKEKSQKLEQFSRCAGIYQQRSTQAQQAKRHILVQYAMQRMANLSGEI
jgi:hypothetical protein